MDVNARAVCCLVIALAGLGGCSSEKPAKDSAKTATPRDRIQGKAQVLLTETTATDAALSAGGAAVYIWEGKRRYRLFLKDPYEVEGGQEYVVEGVHAQKVIDEIGDPDQGKNGYPLHASCRRVVRMAWPGLSLDATDAHASTLRARIARYPARPVFLVTHIEPAPAKDKPGAQEPGSAPGGPEVSVPAETQQALLLAGQTVRQAPLWQPAGGTIRCKVLIGQDGTIAELRTGAQLCEMVPWSEFRYKPTVQSGRPVRVATEVELRFEPRR